MKMKKTLLFLLLIPLLLTAQQQTVTYSSSPSPTFEGTDALTITINGSSINESTWGVTNNQLYAWVWALNSSNANIPYSGNGSWDNSDSSKLMTYNASNDTYTFTYNPNVFTFFGSTQVAKVGFLIKAKNGTGDKKSQDIVLNVGSFQVTLMNGIIAGATQLFTTNYTVAARHDGGASNYVLKRDGNIINTQNNVAASSGPPSYTFTDTATNNINTYTLEVTQNGATKSYTFYAIKTVTPTNEAIPSNLVDGVNYYSTDPTKATLVLNAPLKDFVYVAGSFNNWQPTLNYVMKKDPSTGKFWIDINGLTPGSFETFQYWVCDNTGVPTNSPKIVKTADPFSTLVLSPFDDPEIIALGVYPGLPAYPEGQEREVSVIQTGPNAYYNYNWSTSTTNFVKPNIKDLVIYEVLVRDFDANRTYQNLINKIDYFKNLKINAIQLMPVMEFEGNESWGYNTSFHLALDKRYGPPAKLKEFIDLCHQNGIAVILDVALNHVFGRSPLVRMWMQDANGDGWGDTVSTTTENPYINQVARHSYSVGSDLNHFFEPNTQNTNGVTNTWGSNLTNTYSVRTIQHWINEYKIDGFRWDLTKGFTNSCAASDDACTNNYQTDRVAKLKYYADKQWETDPTSYCIFEHLGTGGSYNEELEWANYRLSEGKGIMQWRNMNNAYANLLKGNSTDLSGVSQANNRFVGYAESHDEERVIYKALTEAGQTQNNLSKVLQRMPAMGSVLFLVPGPKMIWHFSELGWDKSLWTCGNGNVSYSNPDCKLDTKPQYQWTENWMANTERINIYNQWSKQISLRINEPVFENGQYAWNNSEIGRPRLDVWTNNTPTSSLSYVFVRTNFSDSAYTTPGGFPYVGTWYNLMDNSTITVTSTTQNISIEPGGYRIYGNQPSSLSNNNFDFVSNLSLTPNPANNYFTLNEEIEKAEIYSITGQLVKTFQNINTVEYQFNIEDLKSGVYLVKAFDANAQTKTIKLIKR
jgi:1,4-alpha-glucan branching enzyme